MGNRASHTIGTRSSIAGKEMAYLKRWETMKGGRLPLTNTERYKRIMEKKLEEHKLHATANNPFKKPLSKNAEMAMRDLAKRKAAKDEKMLRQMVVIKPRTYPGVGRLDKKGQIWDEAGNLVFRVNTKNGVIKTMNGMGIGKYKAKSFMNQMMITDAIRKYSPYFIKLRQMEMLQQQGLLNAAQNYGVHGIPIGAEQHQSLHFELHDPNAPEEHHHDIHYQPTRIAAGVSVYGVTSNNVWGTMSDNTWGTQGDNVWGSNYSNVWGMTGDPTGLWGNPGKRFWGTGNGKNYFKPLVVSLLDLFGIGGKADKRRLAKIAAVQAEHSARRASGMSASAAAQASQVARTGRR